MPTTISLVGIVSPPTNSHHCTLPRVLLFHSCWGTSCTRLMMGTATTATVASSGYHLVMDLSGARVLVTGASRGIGEAIARQAASRGAKVIGVARSAGALNDVMQAINGVAYPCDLSEAAQRNDLIGRLEAVHGAIDVVVVPRREMITAPYARVEAEFLSLLARSTRSGPTSSSPNSFRAGPV